MTRVMQKDQFRSAFYFAKVPTPIKTQNTIKTSSTLGPPAIQPSSALSTHSY